MEIQYIGSDQFLVELSSEDMEQLDITYDAMDYSNIETRRVIWSILDTVRKRTGKDVDPSGNLMIEAAPDNTGGCFLMFTVPRSGKNTGTIISKNIRAHYFEFESVDNMLDLLAQPCMLDLKIKIFTDGKKYRGEFPSEVVAINRRILEEYGKSVGNGLVDAFTKEHWKEVSSS